MIENIYAIEFWLAIIILVWFFSNPWQNLMVDIARQRLFQIRDEIFDLAITGELDFNSEEYKQIRENLNAIIRYAHSITISEFMNASKKTNYGDKKTIYDISKNIKDGKVRKKLLKKDSEITEIFLILIFTRSVVLMLVTAVAVPYVLIKELLVGGVVLKIKTILKQKIIKIEKEALII